jgi:flagellar biosynthetic protein FliP
MKLSPAKVRWLLALAALAVCSFPAGAEQIPLPKLTFGLESAASRHDVSVSLQILFILTVLSLAPALVMMLTSFARIIIVLSFTRHALGTQQIPPNSTLIGLALFLTFFTMAPVWQNVNANALQPYLNDQISYKAAIETAAVPVREFMLRQTNESDLGLFVGMAKMERPHGPTDIPTYVLVPAFIISELKTAFIMGFVIFVPFLIIDMVVSVTLMSMGMMMLPPIMISLPFKVLLFVMVNGWHLVAKALITSFH